MVIDVIVNFMQTYPKTSIVILGAIVSFFITLSTKFFSNQERLKEIREKQKMLKEESKKHRGDPQKMMEIQKQMMEDFPEMMKHSFKPMLVTLVPLLLLFYWLRQIYDPILGGWWILYYIISSMIFGTITRKLFKLA